MENENSMNRWQFVLRWAGGECDKTSAESKSLSDVIYFRFKGTKKRKKNIEKVMMEKNDCLHVRNGLRQSYGIIYLADSPASAC